MAYKNPDELRPSTVVERHVNVPLQADNTRRKHAVEDKADGNVMANDVNA